MTKTGLISCNNGAGLVPAPVLTWGPGHNMWHVKFSVIFNTKKHTGCCCSSENLLYSRFSKISEHLTVSHTDCVCLHYDTGQVRRIWWPGMDTAPGHHQAPVSGLVSKVISDSNRCVTIYLFCFNNVRAADVSTPHQSQIWNHQKHNTPPKRSNRPGSTAYLQNILQLKQLLDFLIQLLHLSLPLIYLQLFQLL